MQEVKMVQIGVTALRTPTGEFLPSVPLYIMETDADKLRENSAQRKGCVLNDKIVMNDVSKIFAEKFKQYVDGNKKAGLEI